MMFAFAKVFSSLWEGSMRGKPDLILVFLNMLTHCDEEGIVDRHWQAIVDETGLSIERVRAAAQALEAPDPDSRTPVDEGRRIRLLSEHRDWGWEIVNHKYYRELQRAEQRRQYFRKQKAEKRAGIRGNQGLSTRVHRCPQDMHTPPENVVFPGPEPPDRPQEPAVRPPAFLRAIQRIGRLFGRKDEFAWSPAELHLAIGLFDAGAFDESTLKAVERFYTARKVYTDKDFRCHSVERLLEKWRQQADSAREHVQTRERKLQQG